MGLEWVRAKPLMAAATAGLLPLLWIIARRAAIAGKPPSLAQAACCKPSIALALCKAALHRTACGAGIAPAGLPCHRLLPAAFPCHRPHTAALLSAVFGDFGPVLLLSGAIALAGSIVAWFTSLGECLKEGL